MFEIRELFTLITPDPLGLSEMFPFVSVEEISLPFTFRLSTAREVRPAISVVVAPGFKEEEPRVIAFTLTAPEDTVKSVESKLAFVYLYWKVLASSPLTVRVTSVPDFATAVSIPSPPTIRRSSVRSAASAVVESPSTVRVAATSWKVTAPLPSVTSA